MRLLSSVGAFSKQAMSPGQNAIEGAIPADDDHSLGSEPCPSRGLAIKHSNGEETGHSPAIDIDEFR